MKLRTLPLVVVAVNALAALVVIAIVGAPGDVPDLPRLDTVSADGVYEYGLWKNDEGPDRIMVGPVPTDNLRKHEVDFSRYKAVCDGLIDAWAVDELSAPPVADVDIALTFRHPLSADEANSLLRDEVIAMREYVLIAPNGGWSRGGGASVDGSMIGVPSVPPACDDVPEACEEQVFSGVIEIRGSVTSVGTLKRLKARPDVYLVDVGGIEVASTLGLLSGESTEYPPKIIFASAFTTTSGDVAWSNTP